MEPLERTLLLDSTVFVSPYYEDLEHETGKAKTEVTDPEEFTRFCTLASTVNANFVPGNVEALSWKDVILVAKGLLNFYIQENYCGPSLPVELLDSVEASVQSQQDLVDDTLVLLDGEALHENIKGMGLVICAERLLGQLDSYCEAGICPSIHWWKIRAYFLHQRFLEEKSVVLFDRIKHHILQFESYLSSLSTELFTRFCVEMVEIYSFYYDIETAKGYLVKAMEKTGISASATGVLGKRTKHQQTTIAQLVLNVEFSDLISNSNITDFSIENNDTDDADSFPSSVVLEDEDRLDKIHLTEAAPAITASHLSPLQHYVLLADFTLRRKYLPDDGVYVEELLAYLSFLIQEPKVWTVQFISLVQRSILESGNRRTVERAMKQLEVLKKAFANDATKPANRRKYFYGVGFPTIWELEVTLSQVLASLNLFKEALAISLKLNRWEDVIYYYTSLGLRHKAEEVIRKQIAICPSVKLWILLGDATDCTEHYDTAWKLSKEKSARAQRQWGYFHFLRKQYAEAIPHLQLSLQLNPLENPTWIRLGYSALITENWPLSTKAYQHSSALEGDNFEIWNNLANGFIKLGEKVKALRALKEATKCNYENWKVWENILIVATDCKDFDQVIHAYNRLLDLKGKWVDEQVLELLVKAILTNVEDIKGIPCQERQYKECLKLFGRITSKVTDSPNVWKLYSDLILVKNQVDQDSETYLTWTKSLNFSQKSVECVLSSSNWSKVEAKINEALELTKEYVKRVKDFRNIFPENSTDAAQKAEITIKRVYSNIKRSRDMGINQEMYDQCLNSVKCVADLLQIRIEK